MRCTSVLLLSALLFAGCRTAEYALPSPPYTAEDLELLCTVLPEVKFENTPLLEVTRAVRDAWQKQAPGKRIPQIVLVNVDPDKAMNLTMEMRNIPAFECLRYMAMGTATAVRVCGETIVFRGRAYTNDEEATWFVPVSKKGQAFFGLSAHATREDVRANLMAHGIKFEGGNFPAIWNSPSEHILIHNFKEEVMKLYGILALVDAGYEIRLPAP